MNAHTLPDTVAPPTALAELVGRASPAPLTRVSLAYIEQRIDIYLRFGEPARTIRLDALASRRDVPAGRRVLSHSLVRQ